MTRPDEIADCPCDDDAPRVVVGVYLVVTYTNGDKVAVNASGIGGITAETEPDPDLLDYQGMIGHRADQPAKRIVLTADIWAVTQQPAPE